MAKDRIALLDVLRKAGVEGGLDFLKLELPRFRGRQNT